MIHTASCLCGAVRLRLHGELAGIQICHCTQCRKAQGGPFAAVIPVDKTAIEWLAGESEIQSYASSPGKKRHFCRVCGSPLFSSRDSQPDRIRIRAGLIDEPVASRPTFHQHTASRPAWWCISDALPQHAAGHQGVLPSPADEGEDAPGRSETPSSVTDQRSGEQA